MSSVSQTRLDLYRCLATLDAAGLLLPGAHITMAIQSIERELGLPPGPESILAEERVLNMICVHDSH
jgi:hypothetical protein